MKVKISKNAPAFKLNGYLVFAGTHDGIADTPGNRATIAHFSKYCTIVSEKEPPIVVKEVVQEVPVASEVKSMPQCIGISADGTKCKREIPEGDAYCWQHKDQAEMNDSI